MQARLRDLPQQVARAKNTASNVDAPKNPATTRPNTYPAVDNACSKQSKVDKQHVCFLVVQTCATT